MNNVLEIVLERKFKHEDCTEGNLYVGGNWFCHVIEDKVRAKAGLWNKLLKVYAETAIPYGRYPVLVTWSNRFNRRLTGVFNVPDFEGIRIHNGTTARSSAGCPIISYQTDGNKRLTRDPSAMNDLCIKIDAFQKTGKVYLTIIDSKP